MTRAEEYARGNEEFALWLEEVDDLVKSCCSLSVFDLEDMMFFDSFEAGTTPEEFVDEEVRESVRFHYGNDCADLIEV